MVEMNSLPPEVITNIFKYLSVHDRKNVRLTCHQWNDACNLSKFITGEKFVFCPSNAGDLLDLGVGIEKCKTLRSCWEFQCLPLFQLPSTVWASCGDRIQSLLIHECEVDDATISNIIIHCSNLKTFRLHSGVDFDFEPEFDLDDDESVADDGAVFDHKRVFCTEKTIDNLLECKIERKNLTSLELYCANFSNRKLQKLFKIFPRIQTFGQGYLVLDATECDATIQNDTEREWVTPSKIENFVSNIEDDVSNFSWKIPNSKLKAFSAILNLDKILREEVLAFFSEQIELEKLGLYLRGGSSNVQKEIIFHALNNAPKLKELELLSSSISTFMFTSAEFGDFLVLTSKLESMKVRGSFHTIIGNLPVAFGSLPSTVYSKLKRLNLGGIHPDFSFEILSRCRTSLQHLSLLPTDDRILQMIIRAHGGLKTLQIEIESKTGIQSNGEGDNSNENGSAAQEGKKYPFRKLINLEYLNIIDIDLDTLRCSMSEFIFPKLKYFEFNCCKLRSFQDSTSAENGVQDFGAMLTTISRSAPHLESLRLRTCLYKAAHFVEHFKNVQMKYLKFITIDNLTSTNDNQNQLDEMDPDDWFYQLNKRDPEFVNKNFGHVDDIFIECPSLCLINFKGHGTHSFDRHSKRVKQHAYFYSFKKLYIIMYKIFLHFKVPASKFRIEVFSQLIFISYLSANTS